MFKGILVCLVLSVLVGISIIPITGHHVQDSTAVALATSTDVQASAKRLIPIVSKQTGWEVPGLGKLKTISDRQLIQFEGNEISRIRYTSATEPHVDIDDFFLDSGGRLTIETAPCNARELYAYSIGGKVFAYEAYAVITIAAKHSGREPVGAMFNAFYYDEDGDGRFESRYSGDAQLRKIPAWARRNKQ